MTERRLEDEVIVKDGIVSFKEDEYIWNAYGKENIDHENALTDEQWREFVRRYGKIVSVDGGIEIGDIENAFIEFVPKEESK